MRSCSILLLLLFSAVSVFAAPAFNVERMQHDFGEIIQGAEIVHTFRFHNAGDQILNISRLRSSCGCTAALLTTRKLLPGSMGELQLKFNSQGFRGEVQKMVTFETNDPNHSAVTFSLRGKVKAELFLQPERINWGIVNKGTVLHANIDIINESDQTITLQSPEITTEGIISDLSPLVITSGDRAHLVVSAEVPAKKKRLAGYIIINSDFPLRRQLRIPVSARLSQK